MAAEKINGPGDSIVAEVIKEFLQWKVYDCWRWFQARSMGLEGALDSWETVTSVIPRKPDAEPKKEIRTCCAMALADIDDMVRDMRPVTSAKEKRT